MLAVTDYLRRLTSIALLLAIWLSAAADPAPGVLIVGDSWAEQQWDDGSHQLVFQAMGFDQVAVFGSATTESGSTAADWNAPGQLALIADQIAAHPEIEIVQITLGGNDFLNQWHVGMSAAQVAALQQQILDDLSSIVGFVLELRPDLEVLLSFYDYPNFVDTLGGLIGLLFCSPLWSDLGQPTPGQLNDAAIVFESGYRPLAGHPRVFQVSHFGQMQWAFGFPADGIAPGDIQPPGEVSLPSPVASLRSYFGFPDCFHLNASGYDVLVTNLFMHYFETRFDVVFRSSFQ